jgi:hypothetical protein
MMYILYLNKHRISDGLSLRAHIRNERPDVPSLPPLPTPPMPFSSTLAPVLGPSINLCNVAAASPLYFTHLDEESRLGKSREPLLSAVLSTLEAEDDMMTLRGEL